MLIRLHIRDFVLIDRMEIECSGGLTVLTGETGAGKSILLDALGFVTGRRSERGLIRPGAEQATVIAEFDMAYLPQEACVMLEDAGLAVSEPVLVIRRRLGDGGRTRSLINDETVSAAFLKQLGAFLIEIQGQFEAHSLLDASSHLELLDAWGQLQAEVLTLKKLRKTYDEARKNLEAAEQAREQARSKMDFLLLARTELQALNAEPGEFSRLTQVRGFIQHRERTAQAMLQVRQAIMDERGAQDLITIAQRALERLPGESELIQGALASLGRADAELQEVATSLDRLEANLERPDQSLESVDDRIYALRTTGQKFGAEPDALAEALDRTEKALDSLEDNNIGSQHLEEALRTAEKDWKEQAHHLHDLRVTAAEKLDQAINEELAPLKLEHATFETAVEFINDDTPSNTTAHDQVTFMARTNPGMPMSSISKAASGGELARFLLAVKVALTDAGGPACLIFDEVDAGIGGAVAEAVGERLAKLAQSQQIFVVTHSPQVAALGNQHWRVEKQVSEQDDNSDDSGPRGANVHDLLPITSLGRLDSDEREEEVARMLSGAHVTPEARAAAGRLLDSARKRRAVPFRPKRI